MKHRFFGGVCPAPNKNATQKSPTTALEFPPERLYIPLQMGCGTPALPLVKAGDRVLVGQPIGQAQEGGVPVHSGVSGTVAGIEDHPHTWGGSAPCVVIDNDMLDEEWPHRPRPLGLGEIDLDSMIARVEECGVVGMGGMGYPTAKKLREYANQISTLIVNAAECEPFVTADHRLLIEHSDQILLCARVMAKCLGACRTVVVTQGDKLNAAELLERRLRRLKDGDELITIHSRYPLGAEKPIVQTVTGQEIPNGGSPMDASCLVLNLSTVYAIEEALFKGHALTHREITVTGGGVERPRNLWVPIGTPLNNILMEGGGLKDGCSQLLTGGVMRGYPAEDLSAPVVHDTDCLVALSDEQRHDNAVETTCIRCGRCVFSCPMHLTPIFIARAVRENNAKALAKFHVEDCMACGCCSFACPANIPLAELVAQANTMLTEGGVQP